MTHPAPGNQDALEQLADRCGIAAGYHDIWGDFHSTSDRTRRALLTAMHFPAEADPATLLRQLDDDEWRRALPPVLVSRIDSSPAIPLSVPTGDENVRMYWTLTTEAGNRSSGEFLPSQLDRLGERHAGNVPFVRVELVLPTLAEPGYHSLEIGKSDPESGSSGPLAVMSLIVAPATCFQPEAVTGTNRAWGLAVQLYGLRSRRNWGIGDFSDLHSLVDMTADAGAGVLGVNPLHALFPENPDRISPYSPSNRCYLNILYLDVVAVPEYAECEAARQLVGSETFQARLRRLRSASEVAYEETSAAKREVLELLYRHFFDNHLSKDDDRARAFKHYREQGGEALEQHARFEALQDHFYHENSAVWGWPAWPEDYRHPEAPAVSVFAEEYREAVTFFVWLQWLADEQLIAVGQHAARRRLGVGLYQDLALGVNPGGSEYWTNQEVFAKDAYAGSPPDDFNLYGQDWGLPPFVPHRLRDAAYAPFIAVLRANMRQCGALRIDHVIGLARIFWVPAGQPATEGGYVTCPLEDLLGIVALESQRNQCLVIGEDLGTVPEGFQPRLNAAGILSYRPFLFERIDGGSFKPPSEYPRQALVAVSTHDLPTLSGLWQGHDLDLRSELKLFPSEELRSKQLVDRSQDRARLLMALEGEELLPAEASVHPVSMPVMTPAVMIAIHAYLARSPAQVLVVQPEDIFGQIEQANLPGSQDDQHPNWRRRLPLNLQDWSGDERFTALNEALRRERGDTLLRHGDAALPRRTAVIPRATYRFQFNRDFTFAQATELVPYLAELGISHCYASPYLRARPGSTHGYDIVDHSVLNPEIGTEQSYEEFVTALKAHGLGQILDVVPNHMGIMGADNAWWLDVLENGQASAWGAFFDVDWEPLNPELRGKVLLPLLGDHYGTILERGELRLDFDAVRGEFSIFYHQHRLPIDPATYPSIIGYQSERLTDILGESHVQFVELQTLLTAFARLPARTDTAPAAMAERQRDKDVHKRNLAVMCESCPDIIRHIADNLAEFNGRTGDTVSFDQLHDLIRLQGYRLSYWRVASDEINYRRFFDVNDLAGVRVEEPTVFDATHRLVLELLAQGKVDGLRLDHPDGLYDPAQYFRRLQQAVGGGPLEPGAPLPMYLLIEKILADHERLPDDWPIHGATGYRFANLANALFVDSAAERRMTRIYESFSEASDEFETLAYEAKKLIMNTALAGELNVLATRLSRIAAASRDTCDFTLNGLRNALVEVVACFPVYRSYVTGGELSADDRKHINWALAVAKKRSPAADTGIYEFFKAVLTTEITYGRSAAFREPVEAFAMKFQQFSSPVMAKGVEDTAFYRYHRLTSLNDVGGEPRRFGVSVAAFHAATRIRAGSWPHTMLATSTHDSKRSEDVRARINVLSEMPAAWKLMLKRWSRLNRGRKRIVDDTSAPSRNDEYLLYQTLIGAWPLDLPDETALTDFRERIQAYMIKALREAKEHSSWANVNVEYEAAMSDFVQALLAPGAKNLFMSDFLLMVQPIARYGLLNSLAQTLIKLTSPGVPDIYQGCELWQFNLVDPDNRRPVDFPRRRELLAQVKGLVDVPPSQWRQNLQTLVDTMADGRIKLYTHWQTLTLRQRWPEVFRDGEYLPLTVGGQAAAHVCAFVRRTGARALITLVPRLPVRLLGDPNALPLGLDVWGDTTLELPPELAALQWTNVLTGESHAPAGQLEVGRLLDFFPVALLTAEAST